MSTTKPHLQRLEKDRAQWRKERPMGFMAKPRDKPDGSLNLEVWDAAVPGKVGTAWEGGVYKLELRFNHQYPMVPPDCKFVPPIFHVNVFPRGEICLSILDEDKDWKPSMTIKDILIGIQALLDTPNILSPAQQDAAKLFKSNPAEYQRKIREQAKKFKEE
jgi:ubiquitin-conjugating enzyme E2 I